MSVHEALAAPLPVEARLVAAMRSTGRPTSFDDHVARYGWVDPRHDLITLVERSGLRGRGGGGFPTGRKLAAVAAAGGRPVVVVNAAEGEPASGKDKVLLRRAPHLVLDGAAAAATAVGAREVVVAVGSDAPAERAIVAAALAERTERLRWRLAPVPPDFVAGEETALLQVLAGGAAKPTLKPPFPFEHGLGGAPTLVQNAETLAHLALIARYGAGWFRALGTEAEPGTALVTLSGAVARPGVYEIELGSRLSALLAQAGGATEAISAFLVGGYFGGWTRDEAQPLDTANGLGAGVVVALPLRACGLRESARVARYLAGESAGQCGPCTHGLMALADGLEQIAAGGADGRRRLERWAAQVSGRGACRHPDGAARFVTSTLSTFADDVSLHLRKGRCGGRDLRTLPTPAVG